MPVMASTGTWSSLASYRPLSRWIAPGPEVARQTPSLPVALAYAVAMNAAASSWCTRKNRTRSLWRRSPSMIPLIPSPGRPKTVSTPQSASRSISSSDAICAMGLLLCRPGSVSASPSVAPARGSRRQTGSALSVGFRVGFPQRQPVARAARIGAHDAAVRVEGAVEQHPLDPLVVVEVLQVPQVRQGRAHVRVQVRRAVPGDLQVVGGGQARAAEE